MKFKPSYFKAPLPFAGQKRFFLRQVADIIAQVSGDTTFIDVFGGSGLVSRVIKDIHPTARVVYNDFDHYSDRLHHIDQSEHLRQQLQAIIDVGVHKRLPDDTKAKVIELLQRQDYIDWHTLSTWILFSNHYAYSIEELLSTRLYNNVSRTPLQPADDYLDGLHITHLDWRELFAIYGNTPNAVFILDPPYLGTVCDGYTKSWPMSEYIELLAKLPARYLYFSSTKVDFVPMLDALSHAWHFTTPFHEAQRIERSSNCGGGYNTEILYHHV